MVEHYYHYQYHGIHPPPVFLNYSTRDKIFSTCLSVYLCVYLCVCVCECVFLCGVGAPVW